MDRIAYTTPTDFPREDMRGITLHDGSLTYAAEQGPALQFADGRAGNVVLFESENLALRLSGRPDLIAVVTAAMDAKRAERIARAQAQQDRVEAAIPGITEIMRLRDAAAGEVERYAEDHDEMMADGDNDGRRWPAPYDRSLENRLKDLLAGNPRAALYLRAERSKYWEAMEILTAGGSEAAAEESMRLEDARLAQL